jgi:type I restriction enzyme S subunit
MVALGDIIRLEYGKSYPQRRRRPGPYAVYGSNGIVDRADKYMLEEETVIVGRKGSAGEVNFAEAKSWPIDTTYYVVLRNGRVSSVDFAYYLLGWLDPRKLVDTTTKPGLNRDRLYEQIVLLPPLPVQEWLMQILQKADEIWRKRKEALDLAETVRRALFVSMFGEPSRNEGSWPVGPLGQLLNPEIERVNPAVAYPDDEFTYIEIAAVERFRITQPKQLLGKDAPSRARQVVRCGDILYSMTRPNLRNIAVVPEELNGAICTTGFCVIRPKRPEDTPFVFEIVKSDYFTEAMTRLAEAKSLYPAVDEQQIRQFPVIQPPEPARAHFGKVIAQLLEVEIAAKKACEAANAVLTSLLSRAFSGELTAEWEAANAEWIAEQQTLYERLPKLLLLALLMEKAKRASRAAAEVMLTALMKYAFLLQMEGSATRRRLYHFVPYHYGPFAKEMYTDLDALQREGLVRVERDNEEDKARITLVDPAKAEEVLASLPEDLKEDAATIVKTYGELDHNALLETVYEKYPAYARKSRLKRKRRSSK